MPDMWRWEEESAVPIQKHLSLEFKNTNSEYGHSHLVSHTEMISFLEF